MALTTVALASSPLLRAMAPPHLLPVYLPPSLRLHVWLLPPLVLRLRPHQLLLVVLRVFLGRCRQLIRTSI